MRRNLMIAVLSLFCGCRCDAPAYDPCPGMLPVTIGGSMVIACERAP